MKVQDCMTAQLATIQATQSIQSAAEIMRDCDVGTIPVLTQEKLVGILTDRDIVIRGIATGWDLQSHQVQEIMSANPKTVASDTDIMTAANLMSEAKIRRLPIVEDEKLVGMISLGDIAVSHSGHDEMCAQVLESVSAPSGPKCAM